MPITQSSQLRNAVGNGTDAKVAQGVQSASEHMIVLDVVFSRAVVVEGVQGGQQLSPLTVRFDAQFLRHVVGEEHGDGVDEGFGAVRLGKMHAGGAVAHETALLLARDAKEVEPVAVGFDGAVVGELAQKGGDARAGGVCGAEGGGDAVAVVLVVALSLRGGGGWARGRKLLATAFHGGVCLGVWGEVVEMEMMRGGVKV